MSSFLKEPLLINDDENTVENTSNAVRIHIGNGHGHGPPPDLVPDDTCDQAVENKPKAINVNILHEPINPHTDSTPFSPQFSRDRRATELQVPEIVKFIKAKSANNEFDSNFNTISLSRDIFMSIAVLKAYYIWPDLPRRHRRQLYILAVICIAIQFGLLFSLTIEMWISPPWDSEEIYYYGTDLYEGRTLLAICTKFWCLLAVLIYLFRELYQLKGYRHLRLELQDFRDTCSQFLFWIYNLYNMALYILAMVLSVILISTSKNGFEAVLNAVAILFVLDIDNWIYGMIRSNAYIEDALFDIKYEKQKEMTSYLIAKYKYLSNCCSICKCQIASYAHKAEGDETFISLIAFFVWFIMIMSFGCITLGIIYDEGLITVTGGAGLFGVTVYYTLRYGFRMIAGCCFQYSNRTKIMDFITEELPRTIHIYVKKVDKEKHTKRSSSSTTKRSSKHRSSQQQSPKQIKLDRIQKIKEEYVEECFRFFDRNACGVKDPPFETTEKFLTAFDEYYNKCDKSKIQSTDLDFGAMALGIRFKL